jgi:hypothetical protein
MAFSRAIDLGGTVLFALGVLFLAISYGMLLRARRRTSRQTMDDVSRTRRMLEGAVEGAKQSLRSGNPDDIARALDELQQAYSAAGASLYQAAQGAAAPDGGAPAEAPSAEAPKQEEVVEADYEIVDDEKKKA